MACLLTLSRPFESIFPGLGFLIDIPGTGIGFSTFGKSGEVRYHSWRFLEIGVPSSYLLIRNLAPNLFGSFGK